jgi:phage shock protein PspC (stress-responsive transcriptional regulator)
MDAAPPRLHLFVKQPLVRPRSNRVLLGVCAGLAARFGTDPVWVRLAFVALALFFGKGVLLYLILCVVMPSVDEPALSREHAVDWPG